MTEQNLFDKYPILYSKLPYIECNTGWFGIIDELSSKIEEINHSFVNKEHKIFAVQIKQKYGTLRFYTELSDSLFDEHEICNEIWKTVNDLVYETEIKSANTCECCGKAGKIIAGPYVETLCEKCCTK